MRERVASLCARFENDSPGFRAGVGEIVADEMRMRAAPPAFVEAVVGTLTRGGGFMDLFAAVLSGKVPS